MDRNVGDASTLGCTVMGVTNSTSVAFFIFIFCFFCCKCSVSYWCYYTVDFGSSDVGDATVATVAAGVNIISTTVTGRTVIGYLHTPVVAPP